MTKLNSLTIKEAQLGLLKKSFSAKELTQAHLADIEQYQADNAYITITKELAILQAEAADKQIQQQMMQPLTGIPLAIKDLFCTKDVLTTAASKMLANFIPPYESTVTSKLWQQSAIMLGKTNMDEFAMGSSNLTSYYGGVKNPWNNKQDSTIYVPGGSSGGSAAAVTNLTAMGALGSDTGGSIRQPASYCGIVGMKPTYGRCSRYGMISFASSLDQAGVFTRTVDDCAIMLSAIMGEDSNDPTTINYSPPDLQSLDISIKNLKIGIPKEYNIQGINKEVSNLWQQAASWLKEQGAHIVDISLPHTEYALPVYYIIAPAEASSNLARYDGVRYGYRTTNQINSLDEMYELTRQEGFGDEVKRRIMIGTYVLSSGYYDAYYKKAQQVRRLIANDFKQAFEQVDIILTPSAPSAAFARTVTITDPVTMYLNDVFTIPASLAGLPCISVPGGYSAQNLPLGLQLIGNSFCEKNVLNVAKALENSANFRRWEQQ